MAGIPEEAIATDRALEASEQDATIALAQHRWWWTLNKANPERVAVLAYARAVGRNESTIRAYAKGYETWAARQDHAEPVSNFIARSRMGPDTAAATQAVAKARNLTPSTAARTRQAETRRVRELARQAAAEHGTSVAQEAPKIAAALTRAEQQAARGNGRRSRKPAADPRVFDIGQHLLRARREVLAAMELMTGMPLLTPPAQQFLDACTANLTEALGLASARLAGQAGTDWDTEFAKIADLRIADIIPS